MHLVLALLLQAAPAQLNLPPKTEIIEAYDQATTLIDDMIGQLPKRFGTSPKQRYLGFTMRNEELGNGPDGLARRHTFIVSVFRGTPAYAAGVRPGDRLAAIGKIECDTLKPKGVSFYLSEYPDMVPLTLERDGKRFAANVRLSPLPCASLVWNQFPVAEWRTRLTRTRSRVKKVRDAIESTEVSPKQTATVLAIYSELAELLEAQLYVIQSQLNPLLSPLCEQDK